MYLKKYNIKNIAIFLITILPIALLISSGVSEVVIFFINLLFLKEIIYKGDFSFLYNKYLKFLLIFWLALIINIIFSINYNLSILRSLGFFRFIIFIFAINYFLKEEKNILKILKIWLIIILIVYFDVIFEFINKKNILGIESSYPSRISSFLGQKLKIGHYILGFSLLCIGYVFNNKNCKSKIILFAPYFLLLIFIITLLLTGERSNFAKGLICLIIFLGLIDNKKFNLKFKFIFLLSTLIILISIFILSKDINSRLSLYINAFINNKIIEEYKKSHHAAHYNTAFQIFKSYPVFGVGAKNYRVECEKEKYFNAEYSLSNQRCSTHPHQVYLELLSEHGLFGTFIILFILFKIILESLFLYNKKKNPIHLASIIFVISSLTPLLPSGSFFNNWGSVIFWLNFALMIFFNQQNCKKSKNDSMTKYN